MANQWLTNFLILFGTSFFGDVYIIDKLTAVPTAQVARKACSPTFGTGLQLVGGSAPKPLAYPLYRQPRLQIREDDQFFPSMGHLC